MKGRLWTNDTNNFPTLFQIFIFVLVLVLPDWLHAAQSFMTLALFTFLGSLGIVVIVAFVEDLAADMRILGAAIALVGTTGTKMRDFLNIQQKAKIYHITDRLKSEGFSHTT